jgi:hypothetical protein
MRCSGTYLVLIAFALAGCSRYEWVPDYLTPECAHRAAGPVHRLVDTTSSLETTALTTLSGRVVAVDSHQPLTDARVILRADARGYVPTDSLGRFRIENLRPGRYRLEVLRVGYVRTADSVSVPLMPGHELEIQMVVAMLDGPCSGFASVQVRKPWWKVW